MAWRNACQMSLEESRATEPNAQDQSETHFTAPTERGIDRERLHRSVSRLDHLPVLPSVAVELIEGWNDPDLSVSAIAETIARDAGLSAKVLQVVNGSYRPLRQEVTSIRHACALLGLDYLRCITLSVTLFESFSDLKAEWSQRFDLDEFRLHSLGVAVASEMLSARFGYPNPEEAFLAGLLHDIGKTVLFATIPERYVRILGNGKPGESDLLDREKRLLSVTHCEVGKWIAEAWGLPEIYRQTIWGHHHVGDFPTGSGEKVDRLRKIVFLADLLVRRCMVGKSGNPFSRSDSDWLRLNSELTSEDIDEITKGLLSKMESIGKVLGLETPTLQICVRALQEANRLLAKRELVAEAELKRTREENEFLRKLSEILHLPGHSDSPMIQAIEIIRGYLELKWILIVMGDKPGQALQGTLFAEGQAAPETFFRLLGGVEQDGRDVLEFPTRTVLSSGRCFDFRQTIGQIVEAGNLMVLPVAVDDVVHGECLLDIPGSRAREPRFQRYLEALLEAAAKTHERTRLQWRTREEAEAAFDALRRESETNRQLFHYERLASIGRIVAGASHEIRNPLAVISGRAEILLMDEEDPKRADSLRTIVDQTKRATKIIQEMMMYARPSSMEVSETSLESMVRDAFFIARHRLPNCRVTLKQVIPDDLPCLHVDARQIEQVLVNLFINAIQAMEGVGTIEVVGTHDESNNKISIRVTDSGSGIPPEDLERLFVPFFTTKEEGEGNGLGLAICKSIVENHSGCLKVHSRLGQGATFTIDLPDQEEPGKMK